MRQKNSFRKPYGYTFIDLLSQAKEISKNFSNSKWIIKKDKVEIYLFLQPTDISPIYTVLMSTKKGSKKVNVFITKPRIERNSFNNIVPHMFSNNSLCLYYPQYNEWNYKDSWSSTLIPWTSLWLFYYEIWKETGEWKGGGIHNNIYTA